MNVSLKGTKLLIDRNAAIVHLKALGYRPGDKVFFRAFFHSSDPRKANDTGRKCEGIYPAGIPWNHLDSYQAEGRGIYFVVNGGGHNDAAVTKGCGLFFEHDDIGKEIQVDLWKAIGFLEPTIQVDTGGKSIHNYFVAPLSLDQWLELQPELLEHVDGDRKLKNPSRVMRLAGAWHIEQGKAPVQTKIISRSGLTYDYATLRAAIPAIERPHVEPRKAIARPVSQGKNSEIDWAVEWLDALASWRADDHDEWVKVGMALHSVDDSLLNEWDNWSRQSEKYRPGECATRWKSFKSDAGGVSIASLCEWAKSDGWKPRERQQQTQNTIQPIVPIKTLEQAVNSAQSQASGYALFRQEIAVALTIADPLEQRYVLETIAAKHGKKLDFVQEVVRAISEPVSSVHKTCFTLKEFLSMPRAGVRWLFPGFLPRNEMLLFSAAPKCGKSLLVYEAIYALVTGGKFLGNQISKGKALIIQLDEGPGSTQERLDNRGYWELMDEDSVRIVTEFDINRPEVIEPILEEFRPDVVVLDTVRKANHNSLVDENHSDFAKPFATYQKLLRKYDCAGINIHHNNKSKEATGLAKVSGSTALTGAHWGVALLNKISSDDKNPTRHLVMAGLRDGESASYQFRFNQGEGQTWWFDYEGEIGGDIEAESLQDRIVAIMRRNAEFGKYELSTSEIRDLLQLSPTDADALYKALNRAERKAIVSKRKVTSGKYRICLYCLSEFVDLCNGNESTGQLTPPSPTNFQLNNNSISKDLTTQGSESTGQLLDNYWTTTGQLQPCPVDGTLTTQGSESTGQLLPYRGGEGGTPNLSSSAIATEVYKENAKPIGTHLLPDMVTESRQVAGTPTGEIKVGDRIEWKCPVPGFEWVNTSRPRVMRIANGLVQVEFCQHLIPLSEVVPVPAAPPKSAEVVTEAEKSGFKVGDRVLVSADHFDERTQREIKKNNEAPIGATGKIESFNVWEIAGVGPYQGGRVPVAVLHLDDNRSETVPVHYLRGAQ